VEGGILSNVYLMQGHLLLNGFSADSCRLRLGALSSGRRHSTLCARKRTINPDGDSSPLGITMMAISTSHG